MFEQHYDGSTYHATVHDLARMVGDTWGFGKETTISLCSGEALDIAPKSSGATLLRLVSYSRLDDPSHDENLGTLPLMVVDSAEPQAQTVRFKSLDMLPGEEAARRAATVENAASSVAHLLLNQA